MKTDRVVAVLDSLFEDLEVEQAAAAAAGWRLEVANHDQPVISGAPVAVHVRTRVDTNLLDRLPDCRVIGRFGTGLDTVDLDATRQRQIRVVAVRDYCTTELTSHSLTLGLALSRRLEETRIRDTSGDWATIHRERPIHGLQRAAVIGYGAIGARMCSALLGLGLQVSVATDHAREAALAAGARVMPTDEAVRGADLVFVHRAADPDTVGFIDDELIAAMSGAILVNTARLSLMNEFAVVDGIRAGQLRGLAIDARIDPSSPIYGLRADPRVLVTPHIGWYSTRSAEELRRRGITESIHAFEERSR